MIPALRPINTVARQSVFVVQRRTVISLAKTVVSQYCTESLFIPVIDDLISILLMYVRAHINRPYIMT
jgi:hypothetical protein